MVETRVEPMSDSRAGTYLLALEASVGSVPPEALAVSSYRLHSIYSRIFRYNRNAFPLSYKIKFLKLQGGSLQSV